MNSIRTRILIFFSVFSLVSLVAIFIGTRWTDIIGESAQIVVGEHLPMVHALGEMEASFWRQDNSVYRYITSGNAKWLDESEKERVNYAKWFALVQDGATEGTEQELLAEIDLAYVQYDNLARQMVLNTRRTGSPNKRMLDQATEYIDQIQGLVDQLVAMRYGMTTVHQQEIQKAIQRHRQTAFYFLISILGFFLLLAGYLWKFLVRPLTLLLDGIRNFTRGKTDIRIPTIGKDELGELQEAFNEMSREINVERRRLTSESQSDSLTSLFNMRYFRVQLVEEFSRSQRYNHPLALLMIDVDFFKSYNDRNGHPAGDIVLKEVSRILIRNVRGTDIVARYGGEEFVVLLPETPLDAAVNVAEKIRKTVETHHFPFKDTQSDKKLSVSIGVGSFPDVRISSDQDLIEAADKALYSSKENGRNMVCVYSKGDIRPAKPQLSTAKAS